MHLRDDDIQLCIDGENRFCHIKVEFSNLNILRNSEYDQEIPQSQTADNSMAPQGRADQPSRDTRKTT